MKYLIYTLFIFCLISCQDSLSSDNIVNTNNKSLTKKSKTEIPNNSSQKSLEVVLTTTQTYPCRQFEVAVRGEAVNYNRIVSPGILRDSDQALLPLPVVSLPANETQSEFKPVSKNNFYGPLGDFRVKVLGITPESHNDDFNYIERYFSFNDNCYVPSSPCGDANHNGIPDCREDGGLTGGG